MSAFDPLARSLPKGQVLDAVADAALLPIALRKSYDFIIVGGGPAGLAVAARLSEDSNLACLVLEAGPRVTDSAEILLPAGESAVGGYYDWQFETAPGKFTGGLVVKLPRGKVLGGSTCLNSMVWNRPHACDFEAWEALGNPGWNWHSVLPFFKKSETFYPPELTTPLRVCPEYEQIAHGTEGPVQTSYPPYVSPQFKAFYQAMVKKGISVSPDLNNGANVGVGWIPNSIDPKLQHRSSADTAYVNPNVHRTNLAVITNARVLKIEWSVGSAGLRTAAGVTFVPQDGPTKIGAATRTRSPFFARTTGEVILSAGALQSPQLLELSGIGDQRLLSKLEIPVVVHLPGVGENLHDHPTASVVVELRDGQTSLDLMSEQTFKDQVEFDYVEHHKGLITQSVPLIALLRSADFLSKEDRKIAKALVKQPLPSLPFSQHEEILANLADSPRLEIIPLNKAIRGETEEGKAYMSVVIALQHPLSRGSVHITTADPLTYSTIDPNYLEHPADAWFLAKGVEYVRDVLSSREMNGFVESELLPGTSVCNTAKDPDKIEHWLRNRQTGSEYSRMHPLGSAAMLPRSDGGVVNSRLLVYGTSNVRVIDMSIAPLHVSSHLQTVAYMIGEKGAAMILEDRSNSRK